MLLPLLLLAILAVPAALLLLLLRLSGYGNCCCWRWLLVMRRLCLTCWQQVGGVGFFSSLFRGGWSCLCVGGGVEVVGLWQVPSCCVCKE
jgi:hypothetical protein